MKHYSFDPRRFAAAFVLAAGGVTAAPCLTHHRGRICSVLARTQPNSNPSAHARTNHSGAFHLGRLGGEGRHDIEDLCVPGFSDAVAFIVRISHPLEALDHHPEIRNVYGKVFVGFTTHDQGNKITSLDVRAARAVEGIAARLPQKEIGPKP